jgi:hypothetical protein
MTPVWVKLNIFSTRPNPRWRLGPDQVRELESRIAKLKEIPRKEAPPVFGYRGLVISGLMETGGEVKVFKGTVESETDSFLDPGRNLELWLLGTAGDAIAADIWATVRSEF